MKKIKATFQTTASGAPLALQEMFKVENTHVRQISFARFSTFNESILLWKDKNKLPAPPFAVGIWYQQSHHLIPVGVVRSVPDEPMSVKDFNESQHAHIVSLSNIMSYVINRMSSFDIPSMRFNNAYEDRVARAIIWACCEPDNRDKLRLMEEKKEQTFALGERPVQTDKLSNMLPDAVINFQPWVNDWILSFSVT